MAHPARRQREIEHTRQDILHAAARAFARLGLERATVRDIAKEADYTAASLYAYFAGKPEIIDALLASLVEEIRAAFDAEPPVGLGFSQRLEFLFERFAELSDRWGEARSLLFESHRRETARKCQGTAPKEDAVAKRLANWIKKNATSPGDLGGRDPEKVAYMLRGLLHGVGLLGKCDHLRTTVRQRYNLALQIFLHGVGGGSVTEPTRGEGRPR